MISAPKHNIVSILSSQNQGRARILNHPQTSPLFGSLLLVIGRLKMQLAATKAPLNTYCITKKFSKEVERTRNSSKVGHLYLSKGYPLHLLLKCVCVCVMWIHGEEMRKSVCMADKEWANSMVIFCIELRLGLLLLSTSDQSVT